MIYVMIYKSNKLLWKVILQEKTVVWDGQNYSFLRVRLEIFPRRLCSNFSLSRILFPNVGRAGCFLLSKSSVERLL